MQKVIIEKSFKSPEVFFDPENGILEMNGVSLLENPKQFYEPILKNHIEHYIENPRDKTILNLRLEYFNTSSSNWIFQILKKISTIDNFMDRVNINWYYEDEDMKEIAEDYKTLLNIDLNLIKVEKN
jgi:hypothetical protein